MEDDRKRVGKMVVIKKMSMPNYGEDGELNIYAW